jgi:adenylyltransferase/sulfurtransferase
MAHRPIDTGVPAADLSDAQLLRYSRQILLPGFDLDGQRRLLSASALIVGLGGLGSPAALYLAACGVGRIVLADFDRVELSNLQRQIIHSTPDIGRSKTEAARERLAALNPELVVETIPERLDEEGLSRACGAADVVLDATDNFPVRFAINAACMRCGTPLVFGAAVRFEGQITVFDPRAPDSPCLRCLFEEAGPGSESCAESGIAGPLPGIIGSMQALEAIKLIVGVGQPLTGLLLRFDGLTMRWRSARIERDRQCPACRERPG